MAKNKKIFLKAFTLIELLVVIAVIGLLSTIVIVSMSGTRAKARDARRLQDLRQLQKAVELYYDTYGKYPEPCQGYGNWSGHCPSYGNCDTNYIKGLEPWLPTLPKDPKYDTGSQCYLYRSDGKDYMIIAHFTMETICDGTDADTIPDPGDECNPPHIQQMERVCCEQPTIAVYTPGAKEW
jgi:prepilin-type N-terminal cleavage/methylation domain-containing protein